MISSYSAKMRKNFQRLKEASLKLKRSKCDFMKTQIQYLGHLISSNGIQPLPEKLGSIKKMPTPWRAKEVKQFLGLAGYYRKFVPQFSDLSRPLTRLTWKDILFERIKECQLCFKLLKETLCTHPILWYPDPNRPYVLFTDASKYGWAGALTQPYEEINNLKFKYIKGIKNTLTDTLSRLLEIDPDVALPAEPQGTEFGYNFFDELPPVEVGEIIVEGVELKCDPNTFFKDVDLTTGR